MRAPRRGRHRIARGVNPETWGRPRQNESPRRGRHRIARGVNPETLRLTAHRLALMAEVTSTQNPGSSFDCAAVAARDIQPSTRYDRPSRNSTVIRACSGSTIQYSGMRALAYSSRFVSRSRRWLSSPSLTTSITRSAPLQ